MRSILIGVAALSVVALGRTASAQGNSRCDLEGLGVLVHYLIPDPTPDPTDPQNHTNKHIIWSIQGGPGNVTATQGDDLPEADPRAIAVADFVHGGECEILWENHNGNSNTEFRLALTTGFVLPGPNNFAAGTDRPAAEWHIAGTSDFTGDGAADVMWWNQQTGVAMLWISRQDGSWTVADVSGSPLPVNGPLPMAMWQPVGATRLTNGLPGVLWHDAEFVNAPALRFHPTQWDGTVLQVQSGQAIPELGLSEWTVVALGDFDHNGYDDLLRQHYMTGRLHVCFLDAGTPIQGCTTLVPDGFETTSVPPGTPWGVIGPR